MSKENKASLGYISLDMMNSSKILVKNILEKLDLKNNYSDYHITVMYDLSGVKEELIDDEVWDILDVHYAAKVIGVERLGEKGGKWEAIALKLKSNTIKDLFNVLRSSGYKHSYDDLLIHTTIFYIKDLPKNTDINQVIKKLEVFKDMEFVFDNLKLDWLNDD